tara:strand:- start:120 stop:302 length:183 start_codon:yes stop_codon:yes gene_type:complete
MNEIKLPPYVVPYKNRKNFCRKIRDTEKEVQGLKDAGDWKEASHLQWVLRSAWWGYKRYK